MTLWEAERKECNNLLHNHLQMQRKKGREKRELGQARHHLRSSESALGAGWHLHVASRVEVAVEGGLLWG